jgi:putative nucleotidyltransferase-like protein
MRRASRPMRHRRTRDPAVPAGMATAAISLRADLVAAEVVEAFRGAGIRSILLRGPSIARHLYSPDEWRDYADVDLLIAPAAMADAELILTDRGFAHSAVLGQHPDDRPPWARTWKRADGGNVDLHRTIVGVGTIPDEAWAQLSEEVEPVQVARASIDGLNAAGTALVVALHAAHHGSGILKPLDDLARAIDRFPHATWESSSQLADRLGATPAFASGLRLLPPGVQLADRLLLPRDASAEVILRASGAPPMALGFEWLTHVPGIRAKSRLIAGKVVPDAEFMRAWSPAARRFGRPGLVLAYIWRPLWLAWHAPRALRAWGEARRKAGPRLP